MTPEEIAAAAAAKAKADADAKAHEDEGLKSGIAAERKARQELQAKLDKIESDTKAREEEAAAKAGEHKKLYEDLAPKHKEATEKLAALEKRETARLERVGTRNDERIKALPDAGRKAAKALVGKLDADTLAEWLDDNAAIFDDPERPAGTKRTKAGEDEIPAECKTQWQIHGQRLGVSERDWYEQSWKPHQKKTSATA